MENLTPLVLRVAINFDLWVQTKKGGLFWQGGHASHGT
jgi:hypothetical protein